MSEEIQVQETEIKIRIMEPTIIREFANYCSPTIQNIRVVQQGHETNFTKESNPHKITISYKYWCHMSEEYLYFVITCEFNSSIPFNYLLAENNHMVLCHFTLHYDDGTIKTHSLKNSQFRVSETRKQIYVVRTLQELTLEYV
jgi:hypothetical protein